MTMQFEQQQQTYTPVDNPVLLAQASAQVVPAFGSYDSGLIDVRAFNSFYLTAEVTPDGGNPDSQWYFNLSFRAEPSLSNNDIVFDDEYVLYQSNTNNLFLTDQMHGGWVRLIANDENSAPFPMTLDLKFYGSFRQVSNAYLRCSGDGVLYNRAAALLGPGLSNAGNFASLGYGETQVILTGENAAARIEIRLDSPTATPTYQFDTAAAGERGTWRVMLPKRQAWVTLTNTGAVNNTVRAKILASPQPY